MGGDRVVGVKGDTDDVFSAGHICPKVIGLQHIQHDQDRVRVPLKRAADGTFHEVSWHTALDEAGARLARLQRQHGNDSVALYVGNPTAHVYGAVLGVGVLQAALSTKNAYSANSLDSLPRQLASQILYGSRLLLPIPDLDRATLLVVLGANPAVSNGSMMTAPGVKKRMTAIQQRGGKIIVIDPRKNETAELADRHIFVRPGSDVFLLASLLHVLFRDGRARAAPAWAFGIEDVEAAVKDFAPDVTADVTGITAADVEALAHEFADAVAAVVHARVGASTQRHGTLTSWLVDVLHVVTGNFDRAGGLMFPTPAADLDGVARKLGLIGHFNRWQSRVRGLPEFNGELPTAVLAEEIETPGVAGGRGQIKGLIFQAGNPSLSAPHAARVDAAIAGLDTVVAVDLYVNETTRHAHYILPPTFGLENDHYPLLFAGVAVRNVAHFSPAALTSTTTTRSEFFILTALAASIVKHRVPVVGGVVALALRGLLRVLTPRRILDVLLRLGPHKLSLKKLQQHPHGLDLGPLRPRFPAALSTSTKRVQLAPPLFLEHLRALTTSIARGEDELVVIGRRSLRSNNSFMHNVAPLVRDARCTLLIHPDDAAARSIVDGTDVVVTSRTGSLTATAEVTPSIMRGVVSLPHGWGHDKKGARLAVAAANPGVNLNLVTDDAALDGISGCAAFNGVVVRVGPA